MKNKEIEKVKKELDAEKNNISNMSELNDLKVKYLGKKGLITELNQNIRNIPNEEKKDYGMEVNEVRELFNKFFEEKKTIFEEEILNEKLNNETIDITLPATHVNVGGFNPIARIVDELEELFISMGYSVVTGPEVESDLYNFEMLNLPKGNPVRDIQDTFYIKDEELLLRTQTSPVQVREMLKNVEKKPFKIVCPGNTYRRDDDDSTHSHQFMQMEGLVVDENISLADLKGTLEVLVKKMFGNDRVIRFRPHYFPFTEPSYEVDVSCFKCGGKGCNVCKNTGWIEVLGSGMVHPKVLENGGFDPKKYTGFAFGVGIERVAMLKYGINDIRDFYTNDLRFIKNYNRLEGGDE